MPRPPKQPGALRQITRVGGRARGLERRYFDPTRDWTYPGTYPADPLSTADSPPYQNGYDIVSGEQPARFRLDADSAFELEGYAAGGTPGLPAFTLPSSYAGLFDDTERRLTADSTGHVFIWRIEPSTLDVYIEPAGPLPSGGLLYVYSTSTLSILDGLPGVAGAGDDRLWFDQAGDLGTITKLRISHFDQASNDISALLATWDDSTTTGNRGQILIRWIYDDTRFLLFEISGSVTDEGLWDEFPITFVEHDRYANNWPDLTEIAVFFFRTGDGGSAGAAGATGPAGATLGLDFTYRTNTALTDPGSGDIKFDTVSLGSLANCRISHLDGHGTDLTTLLATWDDSTTTANRGQVIMQKQSDPTTYLTFAITGGITDHGTWDDVSVSSLASHGSFADGDAVFLFFTRTGDAMSGAASSANVQKFTASGTWNLPAGAKAVEVVCVGAGGGGGGGKNNAGNANGSLGGGGGGGGAVQRAVFRAADLASSETITVGAGGGGGGTSGGNGGNGAASSFGSLLQAGGGGGGNGAVSTVQGGSGGGLTSAVGTTQGKPAAGSTTDGIALQSVDNGGRHQGQNSEYGGASGGASSTAAGNSGYCGGDSILGGPGGGGGGGVNGTSSGSAGGAGGRNQNYSAPTSLGGGGAGGATPAAGAPGSTTLTPYCGSGGAGGGGGNTGVSGANGGLGGPGAGGGGGGSAANGGSGGAGGNGGDGYVLVITYF